MRSGSSEARLLPFWSHRWISSTCAPRAGYAPSPAAQSLVQAMTYQFPYNYKGVGWGRLKSPFQLKQFYEALSHVPAESSLMCGEPPITHLSDHSTVTLRAKERDANGGIPPVHIRLRSQNRTASFCQAASTGTKWTQDRETTTSSMILEKRQDLHQPGLLI